MSSVWHRKHDFQIKGINGVCAKKKSSYMPYQHVERYTEVVY